MIKYDVRCNVKIYTAGRKPDGLNVLIGKGRV